MPNRKCRNQYQDLFPVFNYIDGRQCQDKKLVVQCISADYMLPTKPEIKRKITHKIELPAVQIILTTIPNRASK